MHKKSDTASASSRTATVLRNANLRAGPGTGFAIVGSTTTGATVSIVGENAAGDWYQLDTGAWIAAFLVRNGDGSWYQLRSGAWIAAFLVRHAPTGLPDTSATVMQASSAASQEPAPAAQPAATPAPPPRQNCDPSYPTICIPPPPPDLNCGDIPYRRFEVAGADPHRFDGDKDGIGCERG